MQKVTALIWYNLFFQTKIWDRLLNSQAKKHLHRLEILLNIKKILREKKLEWLNLKQKHKLLTIKEYIICLKNNKLKRISYIIFKIY